MIYFMDSLNIIDECIGTQRQIETCNSVVISYRLFSLTSLQVVNFPFVIVRDTFSVYVLSKILILIRHKKGFFRFPS